MRVASISLCASLVLACGNTTSTTTPSPTQPDEDTAVATDTHVEPPEVAAPIDTSIADDAGEAKPEVAPLVDAPSADASKAALDEDGVLMIHPTKSKGHTWRLGTADPNSAPDFEIERGTKATKGTSGKLSFWNVVSHPLDYASGGSGWTSRLHIYASGTKTQVYTWKTQKGWLATPADPKDQEFTVFLRVHEILDAPRTQTTLKIRGGRHSSSNGDLGSCTMMTLGAKTSGGVARWAKELTHPTYDYVKLTPAVDTSLQNDVWVGLKLVSYQRASEPTKVQYRMYIDTAPFDAATGKPNNGWVLYSTYEDVEGKDTGAYTKLADWGGMLTTLRTDGVKSIDFALLSLREIVAP